jgi:hypothetical protein
MTPWYACRGPLTAVTVLRGSRAITTVERRDSRNYVGGICSDAAPHWPVPARTTEPSPQSAHYGKLIDTGPSNFSKTKPTDSVVFGGRRAHDGARNSIANTLIFLAHGHFYSAQRIPSSAASQQIASAFAGYQGAAYALNSRAATFRNTIHPCS